MFKKLFSLLFIVFNVVCIITTKETVFWQITDVHLDANYSLKEDVVDNCRGNNYSKNKLDVFGNFLCDTPLHLLKDAINNMKRIEPNPDFILLTGDNFPSLDDKDVRWSMIFSTHKTVTSLIKTAFPNTLIIPVIGNHDIVPTKNFPWKSFNKVSDDYLKLSGWSDMIPKQQHDNFRKGGYFSVKINSELIVLALNTLMYENSNQGDDPKDQFAWLNEQLKTAEKNNIKVIITSHVPPAVNDNAQQFFPSQYDNKYTDLINSFNHIVVTQIYGHLHKDTFLLTQDRKGVLKSHAFVAPSITPRKVLKKDKGTNPSVRLYKYSASSGEILDYDQYGLDLKEANKNAVEGKKPRPWKHVYTATKLYGVPNLNLSSVGKIYNKIKNDDKIFKIYMKMLYTGLEPGDCNFFCKLGHKCYIIAGTTLKGYSCLVKSFFGELFRFLK